MMRCPFCAEEVLDDARLCKHCGSGLVEREAESILWEGQPSYRGRALSMMVGTALVALALLVLRESELSSFWNLVGIAGSLIWLHVIWKRNRSRYWITTRIAASETGLFSRRVKQIRLREVCGVEMEQGIVDRIMGVGTLYLNTPDPNGIEIEFAGIQSPDKVLQILTEHARRQDAA